MNHEDNQRAENEVQVQPRNADKLREMPGKAGARARGLQLGTTWKQGTKKRRDENKWMRYCNVIDKQAQWIERTNKNTKDNKRGD